MDIYPFFSYFDTDWLRMEPREWERISLLLVTMRKESGESVGDLDEIVVNDTP